MDDDDDDDDDDEGYPLWLRKPPYWGYHNDYQRLAIFGYGDGHECGWTILVRWPRKELLGHLFWAPLGRGEVRPGGPMNGKRCDLNTCFFFWGSRENNWQPRAEVRNLKISLKFGRCSHQYLQDGAYVCYVSYVCWFMGPHLNKSFLLIIHQIAIVKNQLFANKVWGPCGQRRRWAQVETEVRTLKFDDTGMFLLAGILSRSSLKLLIFHGKISQLWTWR